jgi:FkbM family methyltransferase
MLNRLIRFGGQLAESHPYSWKLAWEGVHRFKFLLPHDKSYCALRHFIAAKPGGLFLDIGANDGISALSLRRFTADYRILSLEPNHLLEPALKKIKSADPLFDYRMIGAGATAAKTSFFVPSYRGIVLHTFVSADRDQVARAIGQCFGPRIARNTSIVSVEGDVVPIDALDVAPTIMKIDAEGFDYQVLLGAAETIARLRPFIMVEVAWADQNRIIEFFAERKYTVLTYGANLDRFHPATVSVPVMTSGQRNCFAVPTEHLKSCPAMS